MSMLEANWAPLARLALSTESCVSAPLTLGTKDPPEPKHVCVNPGCFLAASERKRSFYLQQMYSEEITACD